MCFDEMIRQKKRNQHKNYLKAAAIKDIQRAELMSKTRKTHLASENSMDSMDSSEDSDGFLDTARRLDEITDAHLKLMPL